MDELSTLNGSVECIIFHNDENGYTVFDMDSDRDMITVVGNFFDINEGDQVRVMGEFVNHQSFGKQFKAISLEVSLPETVAGVEKYLASGAVKGIGPALAKRITTAFGEKTFDVIEHKSHLLASVRGISQNKAEAIEEEFKRVFGMRAVVAFLSAYQIRTVAAIKLWKLYGVISLDLVKENPFILCIDEIGITFEEADKIRIDLDIAPYDEKRIRAGILYCLQKIQNDGHACYPIVDLNKMAATLLNMDNELVFAQINTLLNDSALKASEDGGTTYIYLSSTYQAEKSVAAYFSMLQKTSPFSRIDDNIPDEMAKKIAIIEDKHGIKYAQKQKQAIALATKSPVMVLTGGPGTGKTTTLNAIISILEEDGKKVALASPTGRAAQRMTELSGREAKTIHRLLGVNYDEEGKQVFVHNANNLLSCDVLIVDEMSMVDLFLFQNLISAIRLSCKIILIGDSDQLPPVGVGNVLKEIIDSNVIPKVVLTEIFRQAMESLIVTNAHKIIEGELPKLDSKEGDFFLLQRDNPQQSSETVLSLLAERLPKAYGFSPFSDIQVLCPTRIGEIGTAELNKRIQALVNPKSPEKHEVKFAGNIFRTGDKVMQIRNNYDILWKKAGSLLKGEGDTGTGIFNGDIGIILMIDNHGKSLKIQFDDRIASYSYESLNEIEHAYAITVHKSQGSEFEAVIVPLSARGGRMYYRNLLYTAVTRAKKILILVGSGTAVEIMVRNVATVEKYSNLSKFLKEELAS